MIIVENCCKNEVSEIRFFNVPFMERIGIEISIPVFLISNKGGKMNIDELISTYEFELAFLSKLRKRGEENSIKSNNESSFIPCGEELDNILSVPKGNYEKSDI